MNTFGNRLRLLRLEKKLNGIELGKIFNYSKSTISSWENETREPSQKVLRCFADYFQVSLDYLLGNSDVRNPSIEQNNKKSVEIHSFTMQVVERLLNEGIIEDPNDIDQSVIDMVIGALRIDIAKKKGTKI